MKIRIKDYEIRPYDSRQYVLVKHGVTESGKPKHENIGYFGELYPACSRMLEYLLREEEIDVNTTAELTALMYTIRSTKEQILEAISAQNPNKRTTQKPNEKD
jgi:hypothetical protein